MHGIQTAVGTCLIDYNKEISSSRGRWQRAIMLLREVQSTDLKANIITYNSSLASGSCQWNGAIHLLQEIQMKDLQSDVISFSTTMSACQKTSQWTMAISGLEIMRNSGMTPNKVNYGAALGGDWQHSLAVFHQDVEPSIISYGRLMCVCETAGEWQETLKLLASLAAAKLKPNGQIFRAAIGACGSAHQWQMALDLLSSAKAERCQNLMTHNAAISACGKAGAWPHAVALLVDLLPGTQAVQPARGDQVAAASADVISFGAAMSSCESSAWQQALELLQVAKSMRSIDAGLYRSGINACGNATLWAKALELYQEALKQEMDGASVLNCAISACQSRWQHALHLLNSARALQLLVDAVTHHCTLSSLDWSRAMAYADRMEGHTVVTSNLLSNAWAKVGRWPQVLLALASLASSWLQPTVVSHGTLLVALGQRSQWMRALGARAAERNSATVNAAITACGRRWAEALWLLKDARSLGNSITLNASISSCEKASAWLQAVALAAQLSPTAPWATHRPPRAPGPPHGSNSAATACGKRSEWRRALAQLAPRRVEPSMVSCNAAVSACERVNLWRQALSWLRFSWGQLDVISFNGVMSACEDGGRWQRSLEMMDALATKQLEHSIISCNAVISACEKTSAWQQAIFLLHLSQLQRLQPSSVTYNAAIKACEGRWQSMLLLLAQMGHPDVPSLASVVTTFIAQREHCMHCLVLMERMHGMIQMVMQALVTGD